MSTVLFRLVEIDREVRSPRADSAPPGSEIGPGSAEKREHLPASSPTSRDEYLHRFTSAHRPQNRRRGGPRGSSGFETLAIGPELKIMVCNCARQSRFCEEFSYSCHILPGVGVQARTPPTGETPR